MFFPAIRPVVVVGILTSVSAVAQDFSMDRHRLGDRHAPAVAMRMADMNGDALTDLIRLTQNSVTVFLQDDAGRFSPREANLRPPGQTTFVDVAIGDLVPGGQVPDLAVVNSRGEVDILENRGNGRVVEITPHPVTRPFPADAGQLLVADLDGTGGDDVVVLLDDGPQLLFLFLADGTGGYTDVSSTLVPDNASLSTPAPHAALADCDGDGDAELIVVSPGAAPIMLDNDLNGADGRGVLSLNNGAFPPGAPAANRVLAEDILFDPLPDLVFGIDGPSETAPEVYWNIGGSFTAVATSSDFVIAGTRELLAADTDGDGIPDLIALQDDGSVLVGKGSGTGDFATSTELLASAPRTALAAGDLEGDGDVDLVSGGSDLEDQILLGRGNGAFLDTESTSFPIGSAPTGHLGALVDLDDNGDLDVVTYDPRGNPLWFRNDGSARFAEGALSVLPALPRGQGYHMLLAASVADPGRRDLVVVADPGGPAPLRLVVDTGLGYHEDQTDLRFPAAGIPDAVAVAAGSISTPGTPGSLDDLVIADSSGGLHLARNTAGTYSLEPGAFPGVTLVDPKTVLIGDLDGDAIGDVVVVQGPGPIRFFFGTPSGVFSESTDPPLNIAARHGVLGDMEGDGDVDLIVVRPLTGLHILENTGGGSFFDNTSNRLWQYPNGHVTDVELIPWTPGTVALLVGTGNVADQIYPWNGEEFGPPANLPFRGSSSTNALLVGDLDREGDTDVVMVRRRTLPSLLRNTTSHLSARSSATQIGRVLGLRFVAPAPDSGVFVFLGPSQPPVPLPYGLLRITPVLLLHHEIIAGGRELSVDWPLPATLAPNQPSLQAAFVDPQLNITLSNLEFVVLTRH